MPGRLDLAPQQRTEATFLTEPLTSGRTRSTPPLRSTAQIQWMESLRLPAGMYKLIPAKSPEEWRLAIAKQDGESSDARHSQQYLGSVELKVASDNPPEKRNLAISLSPEAERCPRLSVQRGVKELHFTYGGTDLFVCFGPDEVLQKKEANMSER
jgi:hypothetical protein